MNKTGYTAARLISTPNADQGSSTATWQSEGSSRSSSTRRTSIFMKRVGFSFGAMLMDFVMVLCAITLVDFSYNLIVHHAVGLCIANIQLGLFAAIVFVVSCLARHSYAISDYMDMSGHAQRAFSQWNIAFLAAATFGFLTRIIEDSSRGTFLIFYFAGICALYLGRASLVQIMKRNVHGGSALAARVLIVGFKGDIEDFNRLHPLEELGMTVIATQVLPEKGRLEKADMFEATSLARRMMPDDIIIVVPWNRADAIDTCATAFMRVPASVHLHLDRTCPLNRFGGPQASANGAISSFRLRGYSMTTAGVMLKRASDIVLSLIALVLLMPVFLAIAIAIRLESKGPVVFFQTRHGFNKAPFRIFKFRSMNVTEDGAAVRQVTSGDTRITRVGRVLRKFNLDELPQLINVLRGEMSLVGPRPHAMVHDEIFEQNIALYARRHNVKPGITGWAQVNGLRGETNTAEKIAQRVNHDLYYIDHWSFVLDVWILVLTLFSRKAYRNAA